MGKRGEKMTGHEVSEKDYYDRYDVRRCRHGNDDSKCAICAKFPDPDDEWDAFHHGQRDLPEV